MPFIFNNNAAVDVVTGLMLMYLTLSLSCAFINEMIATALGLRARMLEEALAHIIDIPSLRNNFYNHGLIDGSRSSRRHMSYLSGRNFALGLIASLDADKSPPEFDVLFAAIQKLPGSTIRDILYINALTADGSITQWRANIADWFEHAMHRLSGAYNRQLKGISIAVGLMLAIMTNADTIAVSHCLWHDGALRAQMLASAQALPPTNQPTVSQIMQAEITLRPLPVGWHFPLQISSPPEQWLFFKSTGLLLTGIALSLGASFWFDLLSRFVNLRGAGKRPEGTDLKSTLAN